MLKLYFLIFLLLFGGCASDHSFGYDDEPYGDEIFDQKDEKREENKEEKDKPIILTETFKKQSHPDQKHQIKTDNISVEEIIKKIPYWAHIDDQKSLYKGLRILFRFYPRHPFIKKYAPRPKSHTIVVILPLSGDYAPAGKELKKILTEVNTTLSKPYRLIFFDTMSDMFYRVEALYETIGTVRPKFLIGGILATEVPSMISPAAHFDLPLFTFAGDPDLTQLYDKLYIQSITPENTVYAMVKYCSEVRLYDRFAILYPVTKRGLTYLKYFEYYVAQFGGMITKIGGFSPHLKNFDKPIANLVERANAYKHPDFYRYIKKSKKIKKKYWRNRYLQRAKMKLRAIYNYEAIFLPIPRRLVNYIVPVLAAWDLPLLTNDPVLMEQVYHKYLNKQQRYVQVIGTPYWYIDNPKEYYNKYVQGTLIPSPVAIDPEDDQHPFNELFPRDNGGTLFYQALGYDLLHIIEQVFDQKQIELKQYQGVMGRYFFRKNQLFKTLLPSVYEQDQFSIQERYE